MSAWESFSIFSTSDQESCKKINAAAFSALKEARLFAIVSPAAENTLSDGADVAGMQRTLRASHKIYGGFGIFTGNTGRQAGTKKTSAFTGLFGGGSVYVPAGITGR